MKLTEAAAIAPFEVVRDAEFHNLGLLSHDTPGLLCCYHDSRFAVQCQRNHNIAAVITTRALAAGVPGRLGLAIADDPMSAFFAIHVRLLAHPSFYWEDFESEISPEASVHPAAYVAPQNVRIGRGTVIEPNATVMERCILGDNVILRAGCVVGTEGMQRQHIGEAYKMFPHAGGVMLHDDVEVQANAVVCRAVFKSFTDVGEGAKIGVQAYIAHNARIGRDTRVGAGACVAGSCRIGEDVFIGPGAVISNQVRVGGRARISLGSVVVRDVAAGRTVTGNFAVDHDAFLMFHAKLMAGHFSEWK